MRIVQLDGQQGSLKWMQHLADRHSPQLEAALYGTGLLAQGSRLQWLSPRRDDQWAEYRDDSFLARIGRADLIDALAAFWPKRGPQWDGLATDGAGRLFLLDSRAHLSELHSNCQFGPPARELIENSMESVKKAWGAESTADWLMGYHQHAARLAHLQFLRDQQIDAVLVFIYFTHDPEEHGPCAMADWKAHSRELATHLGLKGRPLHGIANVFLDVRGLG